MDKPDGCRLHTLELKLVRKADGIELDLLPLQGLWTDEQYRGLTDQTNHLKTSRWQSTLCLVAAVFAVI